MLVLQERTNERLRELELANAEKAGLLRAALLDRENLPPELLELKREETIRQMRERIQTVISAPAEPQPKVLDTTSSEIAETLLSSEAALDKAKKVSNRQISHSKSPSSAFDIAASTMRRCQLEPSYTAATLVPPASPPQRPHAWKNKSLSEMSASTAGTGQTTWGRLGQLVSPKRRKESTVCGTEYFMTRTASLSLAWLLEYTYLATSLYSILLRFVSSIGLLADSTPGPPRPSHRQQHIALAARRRSKSNCGEGFRTFPPLPPPPSSD
jgi:protein HOOK3